MPRYASGTRVAPGDSRAEIERTLTRYGADSFAYGWNNGNAQIAFRMNGRNIVLRVAMPTKEQFTHTEERGLLRTASSRDQAWDQACRQRWRALALIVKAKLEAVDSGITAFEDEWLPYTLLPDGGTVADFVRPQVAEAYRSNTMPERFTLALPPPLNGKDDR